MLWIWECLHVACSFCIWFLGAIPYICGACTTSDDILCRQRACSVYHNNTNTYIPKIIFYPCYLFSMFRKWRTSVGCIVWYGGELLACLGWREINRKTENDVIALGCVTLVKNDGDIFDVVYCSCGEMSKLGCQLN